MHPVLVRFVRKPSQVDKRRLCPSHLLAFNLLGAQRLRRSQLDVERLAPKFAVAPLASGGGSRGSPRRSHGRARAGDRCRGDARLDGGGRRWKRRRSRRRGRSHLRLVHIPKTDGALMETGQIKMWFQMLNQA